MDDEGLRQYRVPTWCPNCEGIMKGKSTLTYYKWNCCMMCFIEFIEGREQRWIDGWRPSADDMKRFDAKYNLSIYSNS